MRRDVVITTIIIIITSRPAGFCAVEETRPSAGFFFAWCSTPGSGSILIESSDSSDNEESRVQEG